MRLRKIGRMRTGTAHHTVKQDSDDFETPMSWHLGDMVR